MAKKFSLILTAVLFVYMAFAAWFGVTLLLAGNMPVKVLGGTILFFPAIGMYLIIRELRFGYKTSTLGSLMFDQDLPNKEMTEAEKSSYLEQAIARAKIHSQDWKAWYCVALGYHITGDRKVARESMQYAIKLYDRGPANVA